jgi:hypothetical protein
VAKAPPFRLPGAHAATRRQAESRFEPGACRSAMSPSDGGAQNLIDVCGRFLAADTVTTATVPSSAHLDSAQLRISRGRGRFHALHIFPTSSDPSASPLRYGRQKQRSRTMKRRSLFRAIIAMALIPLAPGAAEASPRRRRRRRNGADRRGNDVRRRENRRRPENTPSATQPRSSSNAVLRPQNTAEQPGPASGASASPGNPVEF